MKITLGLSGGLCGLAAAMVVAAPLQAGLFFDTTSADDRESTGTAFVTGLYSGYIALRDDMGGDYADTEHFNQKALGAARRSNVMPDQAQDRRLSEDDNRMFRQSWKRIYDAWDRGGRFLAPADAAKAQVSYDCWIEAVEAGNAERADRCKGEFEAAMAAVEKAATLSLTPGERAPKPAMAAPAPAVSPEAPKPFIVFFGFASTDITTAGGRVIDEAVAAAERQGIVDFTITGHADRAGPEAVNMILSLQRAEAVRDALVARGVKANGISVAGRGEAEPAVATPDGVREPANRRVEIILL
jgi:OOP family OmpA-OmpF porin